MEPLEALRVLGPYGNAQVIVLTNNRPLMPVNVIAGADKYPDLDELKASLQKLSHHLYWLPATEVALELGNPILANVVILGALVGSGLLPVGLAEIEAALAEMFSEDKMPANRKALARGLELMA